MVTQNMSRTHNRKYFFFKSFLSNALNRSNNRDCFLCAQPIFELPSYIGTMSLLNIIDSEEILLRIARIFDNIVVQLQVYSLYIILCIIYDELLFILSLVQLRIFSNADVFLSSSSCIYNN